MQPSRSTPEIVAFAVGSGFGLWTLACHIAVFSELPFRVLNGLLPLVALLCIGLTAAFAREQRPQEPPPPAASTLPLDRVGIGIAVGAIGAYLVTSDYDAWWALAVGGAIYGAYRFLVLRIDMPNRLANEERPFGGLLMLLGITAVAITLLAHRPDNDDAFYLSITQQVLKFPDIAPLSEDGMYGVRGLPLLMPSYRINSYELLLAAISQWMRLPALDVAYVWVPAATAFMVIIAWHVMLRDFLGGTRPATLAVIFILLLLGGDRHAGLSNFAFVRLYQGKAVFVSLGLPLVLWFLFRASRSHAAATTRLGANLALIGGAGMTSWGVLAGPFLVFVIALGRLLSQRRLPRELLALVPAVAYLAGIAIVIRNELVIPSELSSYVWTMEAAIDRVFGAYGRYPMLLSVAAAWAFAPNLRGRAMLVAAALALLLGPMNPFLTTFIAEHVTQVPTFWRIFWLFPFLLFEGVVAAALLHRCATRPAVVRFASIVGLVALLLPHVLVPATLSHANRVSFHAPGWKIVTESLEVARMVADGTTEADVVVAPAEVASVLAILDRRPQLLLVREHYLDLQRAAFDADDYASRRQAARLLRLSPSGEFDDRPIHALLKRHRPSVFVVAAASPYRSHFGALLSSAGYIGATAGIYDVWHRPGTKQ